MGCVLRSQSRSSKPQHRKLIMTQDIDIARIAALVGEPARAALLLALGDGGRISWSSRVWPSDADST
jgi:DNA-binding transcriptional ArsR family regulator